MNFKQLSVAALLAVSAIAANATVTAGLGGLTNASAFLTLTNNVNVFGTNGVNPVYSATVAGQAQQPGGTVGNFLAATYSPNSDATLVLSAPADYVSFLWGSVDAYNTVTVFEGAASQTFTYQSFSPNLPLASDDYVHFTSTASDITKLVFHSATINAFEVANVTAVPEPTNVALLLAGLGMVGVMTRRRRV